MKKLFLLLMFGIFLSIVTINFISSTPGVVSTANWNGPNSNLSVATISLETFFINSSGTRLYVLDFAGNHSVYQYTLSQAWNISTATYDNANISLTNQDTSPTGIFFNSTGTKMFITGQGNARIYQYTLSQAWNISSATWDGPSSNLSVTTQDSISVNLFFNSTGTKMYITGHFNNVYQYTLSQAWNISSATWDGPSSNLSYAAQDALVNGLFFNSSGTKLYLVGNFHHQVHQYTLSQAWNISTATYDNINFSPTAQTSNPTGIFFNSTMDKMYIGDGSNNRILQYTLPYVSKTSIFGTNNHIKILGSSRFRLYL